MFSIGSVKLVIDGKWPEQLIKTKNVCLYSWLFSFFIATYLHCKRHMNKPFGKCYSYFLFTIQTLAIAIGMGSYAYTPPEAIATETEK